MRSEIVLMWRKFWRSLVERFQRQSVRVDQQLDQSTVKPLSDRNYEFLFTQLLQGVESGWSQEQVRQFFAEWEKRSTEAEWIAWLHRFSEQVLTAPTPDRELGRRMVQLSQVGYGKLGEMTGLVGAELLRQPVPETPARPKVETSQTAFKPPIAASPDSLNGILTMLQQNPGMARRLAQQMGMQSSEPQAVLMELEARAWIQEGSQLHKSGNLSRAMQACDRALALKPDYYLAWALRGDILYKMRRYESAIAAYDRVTQQHPDDCEAWYNRGMALFQLEQFKQAIISFNHALEINPNFPQAWKNCGIALYNLGRFAEAIQACDTALNLQPNDKAALNCREQAQVELTANPNL